MVGTNIQLTPAVLREVKILDPFTDQELAELIQSGSPQTVEAYTNIVIEGELSWGIYFILSGTVRVFKNNQLTGNSYDVGIFKSGNFFGEMSLVDENPRSASVQSLTDCQLFFLSKDAFTRFLGTSMERKTRFYESCTRTMVNRLRELGDNYVVTQYQLWKSALTSRKGEAA